MFHKHRWKIIAKTYSPSAHCLGLSEIPSCSEFLWERLIRGLTTFLLQCQDESCGETKKEECLGKEELPT